MKKLDMDTLNPDSKGSNTIFSERSPENLEKYIEMVEELQQEDPSSGADAREGAEERVLNETREYLNLSENSHHNKSEENSFISNAFEQRFALDEPTYFIQEPQAEKAKRARTANRLKYEAEVNVIKKQIGDLEEVRSKLGLSRRKMCQLLMVDPSAWTRWTKEGAPPYVYRALEWYMLLSKEAPPQAHSYWLATVGAKNYSVEEKLILERLKNENFLLEEKMKDMRSTLISMDSETKNIKTRYRIQTYATLLALLLGIGSISLYVFSILQ